MCLDMIHTDRGSYARELIDTFAVPEHVWIFSNRACIGLEVHHIDFIIAHKSLKETNICRYVTGRRREGTLSHVYRETRRRRKVSRVAFVFVITCFRETFT